MYELSKDGTETIPALKDKEPNQAEAEVAMAMVLVKELMQEQKKQNVIRVEIADKAMMGALKNFQKEQQQRLQQNEKDRQQQKAKEALDF